MSKASFRAFIDKVQEDKELQETLRSASGGHGIPAEVFTKLAADRGYGFTVEDASKELDEADLDAVAGGLRLSSSSFDGFIKIQTYTAPSGSLYYKLSY